MLIKRMDRLAGLPTSLGIAVLTAATALPFSRVDFDPHHDGVMVAAAVAVRDGLMVQKDVFAQYGPVTPLLQGWVLKTGMDPTLGIRLLNIVAIALVAFAVADLGRKMPNFWPISLSAGRWASLAWVVVADYFLWVPQLPWSSTIAAALAAWALLLVGRTLTARLQSHRLPWQVPATCVGLLLAVLPFARINVGLATAATGVAVAVLAFVLSPRARALVFWIAGSWGVATALILALLFASGALLPWWNQAIIWPLSWAGEVGSQLGPDVLLQESLRTFWLALVGILCVVALVPWRAGSRPKATRWIAALSLLTSLGLLLGLYRNPGLPRLFLADQRGVRDSLTDGLTRSGLVLLTLMVVVVVLVAVFRGVQITYALLQRRSSPEESLSWLALIGFALASLVQYAPVPDSRHIWWGLPLGMAFVFASLGRSRLWSPTRNPLALPLAAAAVAALFSGKAYLDIDRIPGPAGSVAAGILSQDETAVRADAAFNLLSESIGSSSAIFLVAEGAWSVFDGRYHSTDAYFVDWSALYDLTDRLSAADYVVTDELALERDGPILQELGFRQSSVDGALQVWTRSP
ncbi:hypothetical protein N9C58_00105 [bacterium]|nr:hypothetical protein [bacterium]